MVYTAFEHSPGQPYLSPREVGELPVCNVSQTTVIRWITQGVPVKGRAERVRLDALRVGGRYRVTKAALDEFIRLCSPSAQAVEALRQRQNAKDAEEAKARVQRRVGLR